VARKPQPPDWRHSLLNLAQSKLKARQRAAEKRARARERERAKEKRARDRIAAKVSSGKKKLSLFRRAVAFLRRKKILPQTIESRKALPTKSLRAAIKRNAAILAGEQTGYKLPEHFPKQALDDLKSLGYRVEGRGKNKRLVVPKSQYVRGGKLYAKPTVSRKRARLTPIPAGSERDAKIRKAFEGLKIGDYMGFSVDGNNSYSVYSDPGSMITQLNAYNARGYEPKTVVTFTLTENDIRSYVNEADARRKEALKYHGTKPGQRAARNLRRRERQAMLKGMRVSRGH
jgi:hypothetical protein